MNERIRELAEQAAENTRLQHNNAYWRMQDELAEDATWREKFAELIVQECCFMIENNVMYIWKPLSNLIKEHFGVKNDTR